MHLRAFDLKNLVSAARARLWKPSYDHHRSIIPTMTAIIPTTSFRKIVFPSLSFGAKSALIQIRNVGVSVVMGDAPPSSLYRWMSGKISPSNSIAGWWELVVPLFQRNHPSSTLMWLKPCRTPSPSHHHVYRFEINHSQSTGWFFIVSTTLNLLRRVFSK